MTDGHRGPDSRRFATAIAAGTRNVLLMLASTQKPPPRQEAHWHATHPSVDGMSYVATTRKLSGMTPGRSVVAFYGDIVLSNQLLAYGIYEDYLRIDSDEGQAILQSSDLYREHGTPDRVIGLIKLRSFVELPEGTCLDALGCAIQADGVGNGRPLTLLNLPVGPARSQVYFQRTGQGQAVVA